MQPTFSATAALIVTSLLLVACGPRPSDSAYTNRGGAESLLDISSEVVNLSVASKAEQRELEAWIKKDHPTRAELNCGPNDLRCATTRQVFERHNVPVSEGNGADQTVTLVYERVLARDCSQRFEINRQNFYNTNHPSFGCSVAANMVQEVTDKQQIINPELLDDSLATRAVTDFRRAYTPRERVQPYNASDSFVNKAKSE